jgi:hypothetical protein
MNVFPTTARRISNCILSCDLLNIADDGVQKQSGWFPVIGFILVRLCFYASGAETTVGFRPTLL